MSLTSRINSTGFFKQKKKGPISKHYKTLEPPMVFLFHKKRHATPCDFLRCMLPRGRKIPIPVQEKKGKTPCDFLRCMLPRGRKIPIPVQEKKERGGNTKTVGQPLLPSLPYL
jgi:hypothetical protein